MDHPSIAADTHDSNQPSSNKSQAFTEPRALKHVPTGIEGLDTILNGGLLQGGVYSVSGQPGAGKTILSNQIAFNHVAAGGRVVFASLLAETHARLFSHLRSFPFFNTEPIGSSLYYISGYGTVQKDGLKGLIKLLQGAIQDNKATMLIVDGTPNVGTSTSFAIEFKEFVQRLQAFADTYGCTVLLLYPIDADEPDTEYAAGRTVVDGLIHLGARTVGLKSVRELHVQKFRGSSFLEGTHTLKITSNGIEVYPRIEALVSREGAAQATASVKASRERLSMGVKGVDELLHGGLLTGSTTALLGPPGSGKTLLGLHFLAEGARQGERGLYFGMNEPTSFSIDAGDQVGLKFGELVEQELIDVLWQPALEEALDVLGYNLLAAVQKHGIKRLFIDGLDALDDMSANTGRIAPFFTALMAELRSLGITVITSVELRSIFGPSADIPIEGVSARVENIIFLRYVEMRSQLQRIISVLKTRRTGHNGAITEFRITNEGIEIGGKFEGAEAILTGVARTLL